MKYANALALVFCLLALPATSSGRVKFFAPPAEVAAKLSAAGIGYHQFGGEFWLSSADEQALRRCARDLGLSAAISGTQVPGRVVRGDGSREVFMAYVLIVGGAIPDDDPAGIQFEVEAVNLAPMGAITAFTEYRLIATHPFVRDMILTLNKDLDSADPRQTIVWNRDGMAADEFFDDDPENDQDMELGYIPTEFWVTTGAFNGQEPNGVWGVHAADVNGTNATGSFDFIEYRIYYEEAEGTGVGDAPAPNLAVLHAAYPNPFNPQTTVAFDLEAPTFVDLSVFDASGAWVETLVSGVLPAGRHIESWVSGGTSGQASPAGVYFVRLSAGGATSTQKITMLK
ncbi:MAG: T9SS type A sorting domain-containing protein [Candidatus Krumholzibacteriia bacterium]|nr:T9SS type A sorting domain-containing protein [bacterium]MCB9514255.1 T9SS type A sorting domain-containing protein [Candidatus Latescibacterota bacterium]